jgi:hypothetical protein
MDSVGACKIASSNANEPGHFHNIFGNNYHLNGLRLVNIIQREQNVKKKRANPSNEEEHTGAVTQTDAIIGQLNYCLCNNNDITEDRIQATIRGFLRHSLWSDLSQILSSPAAWPLSGLYRVLSSSVSEE